MKTLKVRPVLVESKENTGITLGINITRNIPGAMRGQNYELILISLEDEEIEAGDEYYSETFRDMYETICLPLAIKDAKKVIARQSQISPEYIAKFIKQYNNGCVEDLEIEMEDRFGYCNKCNAYQFASYLICNYPFCGGRVIQKTEPKLTKGSVTIIEKAPQDFPYILQTLLDKKANSNSTIDLDAYTSGLLDCYKSIKEPITYTEQDMRDAFEAGNKRGWSGYPNTDNWTHPTFDEWFENNKKK